MIKIVENIMRTSFVKLISTASVITMLSLPSHADVIDEIEQSFTVNENASFRLDNINGSVEILSWNKAEIKVTAIITVDSQDDRENIVVDMQQTSVGVNVETRYKERESWGRNSNSGKVEYVITVPSDTSLSAIDLVNGSLTIDGVKGEINAELVNGSIKAYGLANNGEFSSVNGSIKITYDEFAQELERIDVETVNGSIKVSVPKSLSATVKAETMHGSIKTDFGLVAEKNMFTGRHLAGEVGNGDIKITMDSVNGSVKLISH
jgi:DUF4097 and DUF4098 domain-containing protein YvlB